MKIKIKISLCAAIVLLTLRVYAQPWSTLGNVITGAELLGANPGSSGSLRIGTIPALPITFITSNTPRAQITAAGLLGINTGTPNQLLTVNSGNVNVQDFIVPLIQNNGYMIGNQMTMWRGSAGDIRNIFVGAFAGAANTTGNRNTFLGWQAGTANTTATRNTFLGFSAGQTNTIAENNTFVGFQAGLNNLGVGTATADRNTFVGSNSGFNNTTGRENTFIGNLAGAGNQAGIFNTYLGCFTAINLALSINADENTFIGHDAGHDILTGDRNSILGAQAGEFLTTGENNFIGGYTAGPQ